MYIKYQLHVSAIILAIIRLSKKETHYQKNIFYFSLQSPNNKIHFAHFYCNDFIPLEKKIF